MWHRYGFLVSILALFLLAACQSPTNSIVDATNNLADVNTEVPVVDASEPVPEPVNDWRDFELTDVATGNTFKISDFAGKPILLESFAVWCPTCTKQQRSIKSLHSQVGDDVVSIALDTDPNENREKVLAHINREGFDWNYAISPPELTRLLIDEFGVKIVNAPSAPVVLICEDQSTRFLPSGHKKADSLLEEIEAGCA